MSGPIQTRIEGAIRAIGKTRKMADLKLEPDTTVSNEENAIRLESNLARLQQEHTLLTGSLQSLRATIADWTDLLRKLSGKDREEEKATYETFEAAQKVTEWDTHANEKILELNDVIADTEAKARIYRSRADRDARQADLDYRKQQAQVGAATTQPTTATTVPAAQPNALNQFYQLPSLKLKPFSGSKTDWPEFWESYHSAVHSKPGDEAEKMNILRTLLEGEAKQLISGFRLDADNYKTAIDLLRTTYGDKAQYIRSLHLELARLKPCRSLADTKTFHLELERLARELKVQGEDIEGPQCYLALERKLNPRFLRIILNTKNEDPDAWSTAKFRETLAAAVKKESSYEEIVEECEHLQKRGEHTKHNRPGHTVANLLREATPMKQKAINNGNRNQKKSPKWRKGGSQPQKQGGFPPQQNQSGNNERNAVCILRRITLASAVPEVQHNAGENLRRKAKGLVLQMLEGEP